MSGRRRISPRRVSCLPDAITLTPWSAADHDLLFALNSDPVQMAQVGGAETAEKIADRNAKYALDPHQLKILVDDEPAGWVGVWKREWRGEPVWEIGWSVLRAFQGRGVAKTATRAAIEHARAMKADPPSPRAIHAFPNVDNAPSNGVCRAAGFTLLGETTFEYPPGHFDTVNDWRLEL
ncbi:GNAT family N-acetyltransferase [Baekduia sp. Peel2402]|uniref:GNAT family N-acetyltransferase n=1 Tax=Baekduia sp. Peel2402 TaxID=3458296 RepID=UPI00403EF2A3